MSTELDSRQQFILRAVVLDYVRTAEPIGSEALLQRYDLGVKSATIRNEMAAMAEMGYLRQPHTSAGRIPSDLGYRFYVNRLMTPEPLQPNERDAADSIIGLSDAEIETILHHACRVLSNVTRYTSVATPPQADDLRIKHVQIGIVGEGRLLVVTLLNTGEIKHRIVECGQLSRRQVTVLSNFVDSHLASTHVGAISQANLGELPTEIAGMGDLLKSVVDAIDTGIGRQESDLLMEGTSHLVRQPEFRDSERIEPILGALEDGRGILAALASALSGEPVTVVIGSESPCDDIRECSFVAAKYGVGDRMRGAIGVLGPTRMAYQHAIPAVDYVATSLSRLLTRMSVG